MALAAPPSPLLRFYPPRSPPIPSSHATAIAFNNRRSPLPTLAAASSNGYAAGRSPTSTGRIYRRLDSCLVVPPPAGQRPRAIIKFLGGAFIGAVPEVTYSHLMELLAREGFLIVSVPYNVTFDHTAAATEVYDRFHACTERMFTAGLPSSNLSAADLAGLPVYSVGHSNGALLQLLVGSYFSEKLPKANVVISFNNRPASEAVPYFEQEHAIQTRHGSVVVAVYGDQDKPALITYPDVALNHVSCFRGLFFCPEAASLLLHNFCVYHISPPGHELGAASISSDIPVPSVDELADQVADVLDFFGLGSVMCLGVTAGAYILTLFATKYRERVLGLILVSPLCKAPSWTEWLYNKVMSNLLYYYGMCGLIKESLLQRYFSKEVRGGTQFSESDIVLACRRLLDERQSANVWRFLQSINQRHDLTGGLKRLKCRTLIFVGENSQFHSEALHMTSKLDRRYSALVEVQACGSVVTEEQPHAMLIPMEYFFMGYGLYRPTQLTGSPRSPLSPSCISPELLSPESMGVKLKPIKTRVSLQV